MKTYSITIKETLLRTISVNAAGAEEAIDIATEMYKNEKIVLDASDHCSTEIECLPAISSKNMK